jgi:hypothetical protein
MKCFENNSRRKVHNTLLLINGTNKPECVSLETFPASYNVTRQLIGPIQKLWSIFLFVNIAYNIHHIHNASFSLWRTNGQEAEVFVNGKPF